MSDALLEETVERLFADHRPSRGPDAHRAWVPEAWQALEGAGLSRVGVPEDLGGAGGELDDVLAVVRAAARHGAGVPVADSVAIAGWLLSEVELELPAGITAVVPPDGAAGLSLDGAGLVGDTGPVPWLAVADQLAAVVCDAVVLVPASAGEQVRASELSGELLQGRRFGGAAVEVVSAPIGLADALRCRGALVRCAQVVGALEGALALAVDHARNRHQFGQPLASFQAVQHLLARLAAEVVAARAALALAVDAPTSVAAVATAKARVGTAGSVGARLAHQVVGAIGVTREHPLGELTRRIWSWRDDFGDETYWYRRLGHVVLEAPGADVWPLLTSLPAVR